MAEGSIKGSLRSLEELLEEEDLTLSLRSFLYTIGASQYLSFFVEVELLQMMDETDDYQLHARTHHIYDKYLKPNAPSEFTIDAASRMHIQGQLLRPSKKMYSDINAHVRMALEQHLVPKFLRSDQYRRYVHEKNLQAHAMLRKPKPAEQKPTKEASLFRLLRIIAGKESKESADKNAAVQNRQDRSNTVALIQDLRSQKQQQTTQGSTPPSVSALALSKGTGSDSNSPTSSSPRQQSPEISPRTPDRQEKEKAESGSPARRPASPPLGGTSPLSGTPPSPAIPQSPVRLERPVGSLLESQYMLMPPTDMPVLELEASAAKNSRHQRTPTIVAMELPLPPVHPSVAQMARQPSETSVIGSYTRDTAVVKNPRSDPQPVRFESAYHIPDDPPVQRLSPRNDPPRPEPTSPGRDPKVIHSSPSIPTRVSHGAPLPPLSLSAGALPNNKITKMSTATLNSALRQPAQFSGEGPVSLSPRKNTSPEDKAKWVAYLEQCHIPGDECSAIAELILSAGITTDRIGTVSQSALTGAGIKLGFVLRIIKKQRDDGTLS